MIDRCEKCGQPHKNHCFEKVGRVIYWFCGFFCRQQWKSELDTSSQREFMERGGWA